MPIDFVPYQPNQPGGGIDFVPYRPSQPGGIDFVPYQPSTDRRPAATPSPLESLGNFARPGTEFVGGAFEAGKNALLFPLYIGAGALAETGLAISALAGDPTSREKWAGRLKGLQDLGSEDPGRLEQEAGKLFGALVDDQLKKFHANPARYTGGAFMNLATTLLPGRILALRRAGQTVAAAALAAKAAEVEKAAKAATEAAVRAEEVARPTVTPGVMGVGPFHDPAAGIPREPGRPLQTARTGPFHDPGMPQTAPGQAPPRVGLGLPDRPSTMGEPHPAVPARPVPPAFQPMVEPARPPLAAPTAPAKPVPAPVSAPLEVPPSPLGPSLLGRLLGRVGIQPQGWQKTVQQGMKADALGRVVLSEGDAFKAETVRQLRDPKYALTQDQARELSDLLHSPKSPVVTGAWPAYVSQALRDVLPRDLRDLARTWAANEQRALPAETKAELKKIVGEEEEPKVMSGADGLPYDAEGRPHFPRVHLEHALESEGIAGYRGYKGHGGPRDFFEAEAPGGEKRLVAIGTGKTLLIRNAETGVMEIAGKVAKTRGLEGTTTRLTQDAAGLPKGTLVKFHSATPGQLREAGIADYLDHPIWALRQALARQKWLEALERWRTEITSGRFSEVARQTGEEIPKGWVKAPFLGPDWMVHPFVAKAIDRIRGMRAGEQKWSLLNNFVVGWWFRTFPWAHHPNILFNWTVAEPLEQALGLTKGTVVATWREAAHHVETFDDVFQRMVALSGGRQHVDARMRQEVEGILRRIADGPDAKRGLWKRYDDFTHAVPWSIDAKARLQVVLMLERSGIPFDEAVGIANVKMPNYWLPSFWPAPYERLQPFYDAAHWAFTSPFFLFSPYHATLASGAYHMLKGDMGVRGYQTVLATYLAGKLVDTTLVPPMARAAADYWRGEVARTKPGTRERREAEFQRARWERGWESLGGFGTISRGLQTAGGLLGGAALTGSPEAVMKTLPEAGKSVLQPVVTPGPLGSAVDLIEGLVRGNLPPGFLSGTIPSGIPPAVTFTNPPRFGGVGEWSQYLASRGRFYPHFRTPAEKVAADFQAQYLKKTLPTQIYIDPANKSRLIRDARATMYALELAAARDLAARGLLKTSPEAYARFETNKAMQGLPSAFPSPRLTMPRLQPPRP